jgi:hypothetical protein
MAAQQQIVSVPDDCFAYELDEAARKAGVSRATLYRAANAEKLTIRKAGVRSLILADELAAWLKSLPTIGKQPSA